MFQAINVSLAQTLTTTSKKKQSGYIMRGEIILLFWNTNRLN